MLRFYVLSAHKSFVCGTFPWLLAAAVVAVGYAASPNFHWRDEPRGGPFGGDFLQEWIGGRIVLSDDSARLYDQAYVKRLQHDVAVVGYAWDEGRYLPAVYPPFYYAVVSPLASVDSVTATRLWGGAMVGFLAATLLLWRKVLRLDAVHLGWVTLAVVAFPPVVENLVSSQKGTVLLFLVTATYALFRADMRYRAGLVFGLMAFKPQLTLVIAVAMFARREWRFVAGGATTGGALLLASLAVGLGPCGDYWRFAATAGDYIHTSGYDLTKAHSWQGFFGLLIADRTAVKVGTLAASVVTFAVVAWLMRGDPFAGGRRTARSFAGLFLATLLVSPHLLTYDLSLALLPLAIAARELGGRWPHRAAMAYAALAVAAPVAAATGIPIAAPVLAALVGALAWEQSSLPAWAAVWRRSGRAVRG